MSSETIEFWTGKFGEEYMKRNNYEILFPLKEKFFIKMLSKIDICENILEIGCNTGINLCALKKHSKATLYGVEPYHKALYECVSSKILDEDKAYNTTGSKLDMFSDKQIDLVFTCGVLIHVPPSELKNTTDNIVRIASKYVLCCEYFSDKEEEVNYRGNTGKLFKRDWGSFYLENYKNLELVDYGFEWKRVSGLDNFTWWLFKKI
jgi:pseudaminic acid biosynthesis-associated methylase